MLARWLTGLVDAQQGWAVPLGGVLQRWLRAIVRRTGGLRECPWHGSRFRLTDGTRQRGPTVYDQPAYEARRTADGEWEARRKG